MKSTNYAKTLYEVRKYLRAMKREPIARQLEMEFPQPKQKKLWLTEGEKAAVVRAVVDAVANGERKRLAVLVGNLPAAEFDCKERIYFNDWPDEMH